MEANPPDPGTSAQVNKKREDKIRRRDHRAYDNVMKNIDATDDAGKFQALSAKYVELYEEFRTSQNSLSITEKRYATLQRDKSQLESDQSKSVLARSRMENLCRELQKQNKQIKEENMAKIREEEERRKEVAAKFQVTLNEVTTMMQESSEKNLKLRDDNLDMANKISNLCEQFEKREEQLSKVSKQIELEKQLAEAKIAKVRIEHEADKETWNVEKDRWKKDRDLLNMDLQKSNEKCNQLQDSVKSLQEQIKMYTSKYEEFETTITKSSTVFDNCKAEIGKMNKQIALLEKEIKLWKERYHQSIQANNALNEELRAKDKQVLVTQKKFEQVSKLCRQVQCDRIAYLQVLKNHGIDPGTHLEAGNQQETICVVTETKSEVEKTVVKANDMSTVAENSNSETCPVADGEIVCPPSKDLPSNVTPEVQTECAATKELQVEKGHTVIVSEEATSASPKLIAEPTVVANDLQAVVTETKPLVKIECDIEKETKVEQPAVAIVENNICQENSNETNVTVQPVEPVNAQMNSCDNGVSQQPAQDVDN